MRLLLNSTLSKKRQTLYPNSHIKIKEHNHLPAPESIGPAYKPAVAIIQPVAIYPP